MPLITNLIKEKPKKFQKKEYRPWNIEINNQEDEVTKIIQEPIVHLEAKDKSHIDSNTTDKRNETSLSSSNLEKKWRSLYGAKKKLFAYMIKNIEEQNNSWVVTRNITLEQLATDLQLPANTIKGALSQLKKINLIYHEETKPGRGGYARYKIEQEVFSFCNDKIKHSK